MNLVARVLAAVACVGLVAAGLTGGDDLSDARWLAVLGVAWILLLLAGWVPLPRSIPAPRRTTIRTCTVLATVFAVLSVQLVRIQVVYQAATVDRVATAPDGEVIANPRRAGIGLDEERGQILDRNGNVLAYSEEDGGRFRRQYPEAAATPVVGYYSPLQYGAAGLEAAYDDVLSGEETTSPRGWFEREILGRPQTGGDVRLTLDLGLQQAATDLLGESPGAAVLVDVETGAVLALASAPTIDPNQLVAVDQGETGETSAYWASVTEDPGLPLIPRATLGLYAPGSTFKTVTAAAAIDSGIVEPETVFEDDGDIEIDGRVLIENNRPDNSIDEWTLREGLMWSLNVVYAQVGLQLGADDLRAYAEAFGFDTEIPFSLPSSQSQLADSADFLEDPNALADTAFGQGQLLISPIHLALIAAAYANDGQMMEPFIVAETRDASGTVIDRTEPAIWRQPISADTAQQVRSMMVDAVEAGLIQDAQIPGLRVGGKTGTAELGDDLPHSWFMGFAGDPEARYAVSVVLENGGLGLGSALEIGRELLDLAMADPVASYHHVQVARHGADSVVDYANVRPLLDATWLSFRGENGSIRYARSGGTTHRTAPSTAIRAACRARVGRPPRRCFGHARQRRGRGRGLADRVAA
ncbi:MAG: penicillin-binding protein 2 [Chloroflexota bacterium]|nr:penicillin-binding protein 2 [Chloroflexota bacterium]